MSIYRRWIWCWIFVGCMFYVPVSSASTEPVDKKELLSELIRLNDSNIPQALAGQSTRKGSTYYGAVFDYDSVVSPIATAQFIQTLMCSYVSGESKY